MSKSADAPKGNPTPSAPASLQLQRQPQIQKKVASAPSGSGQSVTMKSVSSQMIQYGLIGGATTILFGVISGNGALAGLGLVGGGSVATAGALRRSNQTAVAAVAHPVAKAVPPPKKELSSLAKGDLLAGKYRILSKLGEGGFGATYLVSDTTKSIQNTFVAKAQKLTGNAEQDQDLIERFEREAAALQQVGSSHGQIPMLFDYFDDQGNFFLIQEQVMGKTLMDSFLEMAESGHVFSLSYAFKLISELLDVIQHLHSQGLIHRDIKPDNVILREGDGKPVLIDFGLVKQTDGENLLRTGTMAGTPGFMPIEQQMGKAFYQSDLYAVGMVFLLLTTGVPPHQLEVNQQIEFDLDWTVEYFGDALSHWLKVSIAPMPQNRFGSAVEMTQALQDIRDKALMAEGFGQALEVLGAEEKIDTAAKQGRTAKVKASDIRREGQVKNLPSHLQGIITTQKEIDAFNVLKRLLERNGQDGELLEMEDTPEFCNIHLKGHPELVIVRLYFNEEANLAFAVLDAQGQEQVYFLNTLRGIAPKSEDILARLEIVQQEAGLSIRPQSDSEYVPQDDEDLINREVRSLIVGQLAEMFGPDFRLLSLEIQEEPFCIYGQFKGLDNQAGRTFDYEVKKNTKGTLGIVYRMNPDCLAEEKAMAAEQQAEEDRLAEEEGIYTVGWLQRHFDSFKAAKEHFGIPAKSWAKLAETLKHSRSLA